MKKFVSEILAFLLLCVAVLGLVHQHLFTCDNWFDWSEMLNHESLIACCVVAAIALVVGKYLGKIGL
jgi:hypothetical protein